MSWRGDSYGHSLASKGVKTSVKLTKLSKDNLKHVDLRERVLWLRHEGANWLLSMNKKDFLAMVEEMFWGWDDMTVDERTELEFHYPSKVVKKGDKFSTFDQDEDRLDFGIALHGLYLEFGLIDKAIEVKKEIQRMGVINLQLFDKLEQRRMDELARQ